MYWLNWDILSLETLCFQPLSCPTKLCGVALQTLWSCGPHQITSGWHVVLKSHWWIWGKRMHGVDSVCLGEKTKEAVNEAPSLSSHKGRMDPRTSTSNTNRCLGSRGRTNPTTRVCEQKPAASLTLSALWCRRHSSSSSAQRMLSCSPPHCWRAFIPHLSLLVSFISTTLLLRPEHLTAVTWFSSALLEREHLTLVSYQCNLHLIVSLLN